MAVAEAQGWPASRAAPLRTSDALMRRRLCWAHRAPHTARLGITRLYRITIDRDHTGGAEILRLSRDRFEDCTHVFESHHHDYKRARAVLAKYKVPSGP